MQKQIGRWLNRLIRLIGEYLQMHERTHADDFDELIGAAEEALEHALQDGERKGFLPSDWLRQGAEHHLGHAEDHVLAITSAISPALNRENLSHAICRLLMAWARRQE